MKNFFNDTVRGFYLCSVVLGALLFLLMMTMPYTVCWYEYVYLKGGTMLRSADLWFYKFLPSPMLYDFLIERGWSSIATATISLIVVILSILMIEGKSINRAWRTKILQAGCFAGAFFCIALTYRYARVASWYRFSPLMTFVPVTLLFTVLLILKKTQQGVREEKGTHGEKRMPVKAKCVTKVMTYVAGKCPNAGNSNQ